MLRLASTELGSFFFQPFQLHLERGPSGRDLFIEFRLDRLLLLLILAAVAGEHIHPILQQLPFPLADLVWMKAMFPCQFADRLLAFGRFQRYPKLEVGAESSALLRHLCDPPRTDQPVALHFSTWSSFQGQL